MVQSVVGGKRGIAFAVVLLLAALAIGAWWWHEQRLSAAPAALSDPDAPFTTLDCKPRLLDDRPALAVVFSQPVDARQDFSRALRVVDLGPAKADGEARERSAEQPASAAGSAPDEKLLQGGWVVGDNPRLVYFPFIQPQRRFRIEVDAGVKAQDGRALADAHRCEVVSEAMPPSFFFASRGVVLPAGQNGGLPVVTVNVPEVDVQFLRVTPEQLPRFLERVAGGRKGARDADAEGNAEGDSEGRGGGYEPPGRRLQGLVGGWELDQLRQSARSVYLGRFATDDTPNRRHVSFIPVEGIRELQEPGVYIAVMGQPGRFDSEYQVTYFYVSDIGLQARRYAGSLDAFSTSLKSAEALRGLQFELLDENGRSLARAQGDSEGHAHFDGAFDTAALLVARYGDEHQGAMSVLALRAPGLDLSEFEINGHPSRNTKLFVYAGRDLYRPGERFELSVLMRDADGKPLPPQPLTATLKRPDGRSVSTSVWKPEEKFPGYLRHAVALPPDAPTGSWLLELRADPGAKRADAAWKFQVEEFLPERMKLELSTARPVLLPGEAFEVAVRGDYLFGAPAAGNRLLVAAATARQPLALPQKWPGFVFGDFADDELARRQEVGEQELDAQGRTEVTLPLPDLRPDSPMLVRGSFSLLESGGRPVVRSIERVLWPAPKLLAVRPLFDGQVAPENSTVGFELIRVDVNGKPQPLKKAPLRLVREDRQYYWRHDDQKGWHSGYTETDELIESGQVALQGERTRLTLPVRWGRYRLEVDDPETGLTLRYRFYAGWGAQEAQDVGNRPDRVQLKLARAPLKAGERAQLSITPPHDGTALVTVEGDRLLWSQRIDVRASGTRLDIPIDPAWARHDLYVGVTALRPGSRGERVTPARAVGLMHLPLARTERQLKVAIQAPAKVLPETRATVRVKADGLDGQPALVTLYAVDVGILNITRFATPDPLDFFFGRHRYAAEQLDLYGKLIEKMEGSTARLRWGGDAGMRDSKSLPKKVRLVELFSGPVALDAQGEAAIALDIPDFNGTLRLMAVVAGADRFGKADAEVVSAAPLVAELATPRFIAPGDSAFIALELTNLSGAPQELKVSLQGAEPVRVGGTAQTLSLKHQQRATLRFPVEATDAYGLGRLRLQVASASGLRIQRESVLQVQPATPAETEIRRLRLQPGESLKLDAQALARFHPGSAALSLAVSDKPPLNLRPLVQGLLDYPYGCLEQTTSAAYPHLFIDEAQAQALGLKPRSREERAQFVEGALGRLAGMQKANGGFSLWGDGGYETWLSAYVLGFMQDARDQGFSVPDALYRKAQGWLLQELQQAPNRFPQLPAALQAAISASGPRAAASSASGVDAGGLSNRDRNLLRDSHQRFAELAHAGYILARDQKAPLAMLRYLHDQQRAKARSPLPLVHLAIALKLMGDEARSQAALDEALQRPYGLPGTRPGWDSDWLGDYGTPVRDLALAYALLGRHDLKHARRENLFFDAADRLGGRGYLSTQERLALFLAARAAGVAGGSGNNGNGWKAQLAMGDAVQALASKGVEQRSLDAAALSRGVSLLNQDTRPLMVEVQSSGYPLKAPAARNDVIELQREWFDAKGQPLPAGQALNVGELVIVRVQARASRRIEDGLIVDRVPVGMEVENLNLSQGPKAEEFQIGGVNVAAAMADSRVKHREYRDDRYVAAARLDGDWLPVFYLLRVVSPGRFVVPAPFAEDMYRPELRGVGAGGGMVVINDPRGAGAQ
ncbi:alpha-2-macroglobulin family protein [Azohydromonas caseinilytica]|uniref:Alpha-2-macroglobulin family protein n=1 Tax=Azohydromonas caseinilytica TaxID=2728836 RepID=A0A848FFR1_9BURK|nr:alpha-2-macroglobulin [Azohydromonas caseinilytica]NML17675.1 alpha-2-macroglobulin family protein [Azohydromonas caseinilytica]